MTDQKLELLEKEMEPLIKQVVLDLRSDKIVRLEHIDGLCAKLDQYKLLINGQTVIYRSFVWKTFYLLSTMIWEAQYVNYDKKIMNEVFRLRACLLKVFDEVNVD